MAKSTHKDDETKVAPEATDTTEPADGGEVLQQRPAGRQPWHVNPEGAQDVPSTSTGTKPEE